MIFDLEIQILPLSLVKGCRGSVREETTMSNVLNYVNFLEEHEKTIKSETLVAPPTYKTNNTLM